MKKILISITILFFSVSIVLSGPRKPITPTTALHAYLHNHDKSLKWEIQEQIKADNVSFYRILFTSQIWRGIEWNHEMIIMVPDQLEFNDALLFINGGSVKDGKPNVHKWNDDLLVAVGQLAKKNRIIAAILWQVPNQPLFNDLKEDALISYTLHNYLNDRDFSWPLLFPMTKSAVRAMDVMQKFAKKETGEKIKDFVLTGGSKRGWTTWLAGANDKRVKAIVPMVIDVLNMPVNIDYQKKVWGDYSVEIEDYVKLGIAQNLSTPDGSELVKMIDPFSYRKTLTLPKMLVMGTNDPYWPVDAVKNYIDSIPGENLFCYIPDAGHGLGDKKQAMASLSAFMGLTVTGGKYPACDYTISEKNGTITLNIKTSHELLVDAYLWCTTSEEDRDFRNEKWEEQSLNASGKPEITVDIKYPETGYKAFYVDLKYKAPFGGDYTQSTRMFVADKRRLLLKEH